jgi:tetratricopeptide (TPR) repeat protein
MPNQTEVVDTFLAMVRHAYEHGDWKDVVRMGSVLSRPLWISGRYQERIELGKLVESAAGFLKDRDVQAQALVDDLGWTCVVVGRIKEAKVNIQRGINLARDSGNSYVEAKGHRHLSGIASMYERNPEVSVRELRAAREAAANIQDARDRTEMIAGVDVNEAIVLQESEKWEESLPLLERAQGVYRHIKDLEREVKIYAWRGLALLSLGRLGDAKDQYREGLVRAKEQGRKDEVFKNHVGLARIAEREQDRVEAKHQYQQALLISADLDLQHEVAEIRSALKRLERGT